MGEKQREKDVREGEMRREIVGKKGSERDGKRIGKDDRRKGYGR